MTVRNPQPITMLLPTSSYASSLHDCFGYIHLFILLCLGIFAPCSSYAIRVSLKHLYRIWVANPAWYPRGLLRGCFVAPPVESPGLKTISISFFGENVYILHRLKVTDKPRGIYHLNFAFLVAFLVISYLFLQSDQTSVVVCTLKPGLEPLITVN